MTDETAKQEAAAADTPVDQIATALVWFSVSPMKNYKFGRWQFKDGALGLTPFEAEQFRKEVASLPENERIRIKEIDSQKGVAMVRAHQAAVQGMTDTGAQGMKLQAAQAASPKLGTKTIQ